jgi:hypothetical protein
MIKKVDLGAAAFYKGDNKPTTATIVSFRQNMNVFKELFNDCSHFSPHLLALLSLIQTVPATFWLMFSVVARPINLLAAVAIKHLTHC